MILVRDIFQLKFGKAREALSLWKEGREILNKADYTVDRILTDLTGPYYTLVMESTYDNLTQYDKALSSESGSDEWKAFYQKFVALVDSGRREIFTIVKP
jgi:hypothetical protein